MDEIKVPKSKVNPPGILNPESMQILQRLVLDEKPSVYPVMLIQGFCGLRTEELMRLDWKEVHFFRKLIEVTAANSKRGKRRLVDVPEGVASELEKFSKKSGSVAPSEFPRWAMDFRNKIPGEFQKTHCATHLHHII